MIIYFFVYCRHLAHYFHRLILSAAGSNARLMPHGCVVLPKPPPKPKHTEPLHEMRARVRASTGVPHFARAIPYWMDV